MSMPEPLPVVEPQKKSRTGMIIAIVVILVCCCCLAIVILGWQFGDALLNMIKNSTGTGAILNPLFTV